MSSDIIKKPIYKSLIIFLLFTFFNAPYYGLSATRVFRCGIVNAITAIKHTIFFFHFIKVWSKVLLSFQSFIRLISRLRSSSSYIEVWQGRAAFPPYTKSLKYWKFCSVISRGNSLFVRTYSPVCLCCLALSSLKAVKFTVTSSPVVHS